MSLGGGHNTGSNCDTTDPTRQAALANLRAVGIAPVIASGNGDENGNGYTDGIAIPGCLSAAVAVGATETNYLSGPISTYISPNWPTNAWCLAYDGSTCYGSGTEKIASFSNASAGAGTARARLLYRIVGVGDEQQRYQRLRGHAGYVDGDAGRGRGMGGAQAAVAGRDGGSYPGDAAKYGRRLSRIRLIRVIPSSWWPTQNDLSIRRAGHGLPADQRGRGGVGAGARFW